MQCPECQHVVENDTATCHVCGCPLARRCGSCHKVNRPNSKFCTACGNPLGCGLPPALYFGVPPDWARFNSSISAAWTDAYGNQSERKPVTVLFLDLSGYSALCERMDPEDVREMMNLVFKEIVGIIIRYEGYIDRIIGDEVLAVFGIPCIHEDDPVRAIRAAVDIHSAVTRMTGRFSGRLEKPLMMHSGIATGLVVTGISDLRTGRHGITGEPGVLVDEPGGLR